MRIEDIAGSPDFCRLSAIAGAAVELRYATADNFVGCNLYGDIDCGWLHREAAQALEKSIAWLALACPDVQMLVLDALRPQRVQEQLWAALDGTDLQMYLAEPLRGSIHSFGMALDLTLVDVQGRELDMGTPFDDLSELSHPTLEGIFLASGQLHQQQIANRQLLRAAMAHGGWQGIHTEWWHFDCGERELVRAHFTRIL